MIEVFEIIESIIESSLGLKTFVELISKSAVRSSLASPETALLRF
jgi:hypothetical protein